MSIGVTVELKVEDIATSIKKLKKRRQRNATPLVVRRKQRNSQKT